MNSIKGGTMDDLKPINLAFEEKQTSPVQSTQPTTAPVKSTAKKKMTTTILALVFAGIATGFGLFYFTQRPKSAIPSGTIDEGEIKKGMIVGMQDKETFRDSAEGKLVSGGIDGEGSHHLEREGGESQNVYLTSSVVDLDQFLDRKIKIWGETFEAQKAGWLMDVGRLEVIE